MAPRDNTAEHEAQAAEPDRPVTMTVRLPSEILDGIERRNPRILVGPDAYVLDVLVRLFPASYQKGAVVMAKRAGLV